MCYWLDLREPQSISSLWQRHSGVFKKILFYGKNIFFLNVWTKFKFKMRPTWWFWINSQAAMKWINACVCVWSNAHILTSKLWKRISHLCHLTTGRVWPLGIQRQFFTLMYFCPCAVQKQLVWLDEIQPMQFAVLEVYQIIFPNFVCHACVCLHS